MILFGSSTQTEGKFYYTLGWHRQVFDLAHPSLGKFYYTDSKIYYMDGSPNYTDSNFTHTDGSPNQTEGNFYYPDGQPYQVFDLANPNVGLAEPEAGHFDAGFC
jgi:hypothetical protein